MLGEFGGFGLGVDGHTWSQQTWGYQGVADSQKLTGRYGLLAEKVWTFQKSSALAAAVYTQLTSPNCHPFMRQDLAFVLP